MPPAMFNTRRLRMKRQLFKVNFGGNENNPQISGSDNKVVFGAGNDKEERTTLLRKAGDQVGKILEGGTNIAIAPAKWLEHMQENWYEFYIILYTDPLWKPSLCGIFLSTTDTLDVIRIYIAFRDLLIDSLCIITTKSFHKMH